MTDCTLIGGFYWEAGKCLFGVAVTAGVLVLFGIALGIARLLDGMRK